MGRPKGSKNKPKNINPTVEAAAPASPAPPKAKEVVEEVKKKRPGRPPGSVNKKNKQPVNTQAPAQPAVVPVTPTPPPPVEPAKVEDQTDEGEGPEVKHPKLLELGQTIYSAMGASQRKALEKKVKPNRSAQYIIAQVLTSFFDIDETLLDKADKKK